MLLAKPVDQLHGHIDLRRATENRAIVPVGDGAALLKRRPDIRQAERRLAASTAGIGVATGELYPDISIGATIGTVGLIDDLGDPSTNRWGFGPSLSWKVPTNGARARIREAEAATQGALAHFDGVVLNAIRETQTGLAQYTALLQRRDALADANSRRNWLQTRRTVFSGRPRVVPCRPASDPHLHRCHRATGRCQHSSRHEPDRFVPRHRRRLGKRTNASLKPEQTLTP